MHKFSYKSLLIIFFFLLIGVIVLWKFILPNQKVSAAWWNDSWMYRKAVSISNTSGSNLTDFQVSLSVGTSALIASGKMQSDCDDIRVTDINGNLLPYWIEENNPGCNAATDTKIWIKASSLPTSGSTVYLYYGNTSAANNENGKNVFLEFDDFNNSSTINNWTLESNPNTTYSIAGGTMAAVNSGGDYSSAVLGNNYTDIIVNSRFSVNVTQSHGGFVFRGQTTAADNSYQWMIREGTSDNRIQKRLNSGQSYLLGGALGTSLPSTLTAGNWYPIEFRLFGTQIDTYFNNQKAINGNFADTSFTSGKVGILSYDGIEYFDYFFVRKYASSEPTPTLQSEELSLAPIAYWKFDDIYNGYTTLEYITINNDITNGYFNSINTNTSYNNATKLEFTIKSTDTVSNIMLVSGYSSPTTRAYPCILGSSYISPSSFTTSTLTPSNVTRSQVSDGTMRTFTLDFTTSSSYPISFGSWQDSSWSRTVNWYSFKIWNSSTMVKNFVPVKRNSDNTLGFYDTVTNTFYTNASTGSFTAGPEITHDSTGNNNGILGIGNSAPTWVSEDQCISGKCLSFPGANSNFIVTDNNLLKPSQITISGWVKINQSKNQYIINKGDGSATGAGYNVYIYSNNRLAFWFYNGAGNLILIDTGVDSIQLNNWYFFEATYNGTNSKIYLNGVLKNTSSNTSGFTQKNTNLNISNNSFDGLIDEVKIYPYARTADQIKQDYNSRGSVNSSSSNLGIKSNTTPSLSSSLVAYWKFDENNGTSVFDSSENNITGTFVGTTKPTWQTGKYKSGIGFSGVNDSISLPFQPNFRNAFSVSIWFKRTTDYNQTTDIMLLSPPSAWYFYDSYNSGAIRGDVYIDGVRRAGINVPIPFDGNWYHVAYTYDSATHIAKMYKNGKIYQSVDLTSLGLSNYLIDSATGNLSNLGRNTNRRGIVVDEAKIYNRALTPEEVKQDYNAGSAIQFGSTSQSIGGTTTSLEYCIPGDTSTCSAPISEWNFEENTGTTAKDTRGNNNGTFGTGSSAPTWTIGKKNTGAGLKFNGNDYINNGITQGYTGNLNINFWIKTNSSTTGTIVSKYGNNSYWTYRIYTDANGKINFERGNNTAAWTNTLTSIKNINDNNWHFVSANYDSTKMYIYIDGQLDNSVTETRAADGTNYYNFCIGNDHHYCTPAGPKGFFNGS
ncbi:MAG: DUF2341 domain-containing protein, partial [Candidatus Shapirobacteria bacterium]